MNSDTYYGIKAQRYDRVRENDANWKPEIELIRKLVIDGPLLDVPVGTGRFIPIYRDRGIDFEGLDTSQDMIDQAVMKYGDFPYRIGSILDLPYEDNQFKTAVCVRMLTHLKKMPGCVERAISELQRVAETVIVSTSKRHLPLFRKPTEVHPISGKMYVMVKC